MKTRNIGIKVTAPKNGCTDSKCPFHGNCKLRGRVVKGVVLGKDTHRTATIEQNYRVAVPKYGRTEVRRTKIHVHNPSCIDANVGDIVQIAETRPLSKTKNFVIVKNVGKEKGFIEKLEARKEAKVKEEPEKEQKVEKAEGESEESPNDKTQQETSKKGED